MTKYIKILMDLAEFKEEDIQDNSALFLFIDLHNESYISFTRFTFSVIFPEYLYLNKLKLMTKPVQKHIRYIKCIFFTSTDR